MENSNAAHGIEQETTSGLRLILASSSPRRRELIALLGLPYHVVPSRYEEPPAPDTPVHLPEFVTRLALGKAQEVAERLGHELNAGAVVLGADTLVAPDDAEIGIPLGKPRDEQDARRMLRQLSGRTHRVYTGIALVTKQGTEEEKRRKGKEGTRTQGTGNMSPRGRPEPETAASTDSEALFSSPSLLLFCSSTCTRVRFRTLTDTMIADYAATGEPLDKAGAYGAQGYAAPFIEALEGDFFNVVGLPLCEVGRMLERIQNDWWRHRNVVTAQAK